MLKIFYSLKLTKSLQSKLPNLIQAYSINKFSTNDKDDNNKKKGFMDDLTETAQKAAEKLGLKTPTKDQNQTKSYGQANSSYGKADSDKDSSSNSNLYNEAKDNLRKGYQNEDRNPQRHHGQQATYGSPGLGTSDGSCNSHTTNDKKSLDEIRKTQNDLNKTQDNRDSSTKNCESDKQNQSNKREGFSGGMSEAERKDFKDSIYNSSGSTGSSKAESFPGSKGAFKKTPDSGGEYGSHGLRDQSGSSGKAGKEDVSGINYGASGTGSINPNRSDLGAKSGKSEADRSTSDNKTSDTLKNQSEMRNPNIKNSSINQNLDDNLTNKDKRK